MLNFPRIRLLLLFFLIAACTPQQQQTYNVLLVADGRERGWQVDEPITVQEFLEQVDIEMSPLDRMVPEPWTQIFDGLRITIVRVREEEFCEDLELPFGRRTEPVEGLAPGEERIAQPGENGIEEVCYRVLIEDGIRQESVVTSRTISRQPKDEVVWIGPTEQLEPVSVTGSLAYINNNNAWVIRGSSRNKRNLTIEGDLDSRVFSLSEDGRQLLFTRRSPDVSGQSNQLWMMSDITRENLAPIPLAQQDVIYAEWVPGRDSMIAYSTFEPQNVSPGWRALNDLWRIRVDPQTGEQINIEPILESNGGGLYGWWGTQFSWSRDGNRLAWVRADGVGLVDFENNAFGPYLTSYTALTPNIGDWSWRATVSWSPDGSLLATTVHGPPVGSEPAASSPVFNVAVAAADGNFTAEIVNRAGIWSAPQFSPEFSTADNPFPQGYLAYFVARDWQNSISGEYDLVVADRDGSNARVIFPQTSGQRGLQDEDLQMAWSPDARQLAFIYQGNLWVIDVETGIAHQLTVDGGASSPVWAR